MVEPLQDQNQLLYEISQGDEVAFRRIVLHYKDVVYSAGMRMTGSSHLAEDILQETFLKVWLQRKILPEIENFGGWLYRIARNQIVNSLKKLSVEAGLSSQLKSQPATELHLPSHALEQKEIEKIIDTAVRHLPQKQMHVYILVKVIGLTREEAAAKLKVSPETIKSNLDHAMRFVRNFCLKNLDETFMSGSLVLLFSYFF